MKQPEFKEKKNKNIVFLSLLCLIFGIAYAVEQKSNIVPSLFSLEQLRDPSLLKESGKKACHQPDPGRSGFLV